MKIKAIIFDFDDTLTDNKTLDFESFRHLSLNLGLSTLSRREIRKLRCKSLLAKDIISLMIQRSVKPVSLDLCIKMRNEFLRGKESERLIRMRPGLHSMLKKLASQGYILLIATSRTEGSSLKTILQNHRLAGYFRNVYTSQNGNKTDIYKKVMCDLDLLAGECLVMSNTFQDLLPAQNLGMKVAGIEGSYGLDPALLEQVDVLEDLTQLSTYIQSKSI